MRANNAQEAASLVASSATEVLMGASKESVESVSLTSLAGTFPYRHLLGHSATDRQSVPRAGGRPALKR
jgi:hypothetical protein